ncbi:MAG TPA: glycosyltransferase family A protein, partial [Microthrixaceae bacterium]|nr:glycosyltransferase family A protein [Microthrixaceae bacterium]
NYEVILVDDGGSDELAEWASLRGEANVRVVRQENAGVSAARNLGIKSARGDLIGFCDSDDLWTPTTARNLAACFDGNPEVGLAYGWYDVIDDQGAPNGRVVRSDASGEVWDYLVTRNPIAASGVMVSREAFDDVGGFAENRDRFRIDVEDWEMWIRLASKWHVGLVPAVVTRHRRHDSNSSSDVESLEAAYTNLLEVVFADVTPERAALRPIATARTQMILAWQSLNDREDPRKALVHLANARRHAPELARTFEYWRLRLAATGLRLTGPLGYAALRRANWIARRALNLLRLNRFRRKDGAFAP